MGLAKIVTENKRSIMQALPPFMQNDKAMARFLQTCISSIHRNPALLNCTPESFFSAARQAAMLGLPPDGAMQLAHLIPYGQNVQFQIGYKGLIELARRTGNIKSIYAYCVYPGDEFRYTLGLKRDLVHVPADHLAVEGMDAVNIMSDGEVVSDRPIYGYAVAILKDDTTEFEVINRKYIDKIKKFSRSSNHKDSPWVLWEDSMIRKTAIKRVLSLIPSNPDDALSRAIALDNDIDSPLAPKDQVARTAPATVIQVVSSNTEPVKEETASIPHEVKSHTPVPTTASGSNALDAILQDSEPVSAEDRTLPMFPDPEYQPAKPKRRSQ